ncbi:MAG: hypothetical protein ACYC0B_05915 [Gemmatimonadaceae bacterium]
MSVTRRDFIDRLAVGTVAFGGLSLGAAALPAPLHALERRESSRLSEFTLRPAIPGAQPEAWDTSWPKRLTGKVKAIFDVPEVDSGYGVWRATFWAMQYEQVMGIPARDLSTALVLRHNGIALAMQQPFWDKYGIGKMKQATSPVTHEPTDRNPALMSSARGEQPADYDEFALDRFIARGGVVLGCDLALHECVRMIQRTDGIGEADARKIAIAALVPGVILQPSGIFAVVLGEQAGAHYVRAS